MQSSPFPDNGRKVSLTVTAGSTLAEIFLIDHAFRLVERSVGNLEVKVPPGAYKVKAALGEAATERLIVLRSSATIDLGEDLEIISPAPLDGTGLTEPAHMELAEQRSTGVTESAGHGATVLIVSRRDGETGDPEEAPLDKLSLHAPDGEVVVDLAGRSGHDPAVGIAVEVDPGPYRLHWRDHAGIAAEQTVIAVADWQTQVFILEDALGPRESLRNKVSILMSPSGRGFDPRAADLRQVEEARTALADERKVSGVQNNALFAKFENPMLGLFGAHLMLVGQEAKRYAAEAESRSGPSNRPQAPVDFDQALFDEAVGNLRNLLGEDHPDVVALSTRVGAVDRESIRPIDVPPMLWHSWLLLVEASNDYPDLVPVHMWRDTARQLPLRPFLVWSPVEDGEDVAGAELEMARLMKRTVDEAAGAAASAAADAAQRELAGRMVAPRAAVEELIRSVS